MLKFNNMKGRSRPTEDLSVLIELSGTARLDGVGSRYAGARVDGLHDGDRTNRAGSQKPHSVELLVQEFHRREAGAERENVDEQEQKQRVGL